MARIVIYNDTDPAIGIELKETPGGPSGWSGTCTECGRTMHKWRQDHAIRAAQNHVDEHESSL